MTMPELLSRGRAAYDAQAWNEAYGALSAAAREAALDAEDLLRLAHAAGLTGRDADAGELLARAYQAFLGRDDVPAAARCAFWLGMRLQNLGERIRGGGWLARARRMLAEAECDCVEQGYVLVPLARQMAEEGDVASGLATMQQAYRIGQRFRDPDLLALARMGLGLFQVYAGAAADGLAELDEVMVAVEAGEVSPLVTGIVYCAVIDACGELYDLRRAQEWTGALTRWCEAHPDLVPFRGQCQVHRAQILQLHGAWSAALELTQGLATEHAAGSALPAIGPAWYQTAELHRLSGDFGRAEDAYRAASRCGFVPEPGLALLRLAQGQADAAATSIARALDEARSGPQRARLLPAFVEIMLASGDLAAARAAAVELASVAQALQAAFLEACAAHALGAVLLAEGDPRAALDALREACRHWLQLEAPYETARTRELIGLACQARGDQDRARLELDAAAWTFRQLGALPDLARVEARLRRRTDAPPGGLTQREVEVLRLLAAGKTNRAIADELVLSEKTVARHVSNIFTKLQLSSRSAATAYAYEHALV